MLKRVWREGNPPALLVGMLIGIAVMRAVWGFLKKLKIELQYDLAVPLLGVYLEGNMIQKDTWAPVFTGALFTVAKST